MLLIFKTWKITLRISLNFPNEDAYFVKKSTIYIIGNDYSGGKLPVNKLGGKPMTFSEVIELASNIATILMFVKAVLSYIKKK